MVVLDILSRYRSDPDYDIPSWHDVRLKTLLLIHVREVYEYLKIYQTSSVRSW